MRKNSYRPICEVHAVTQLGSIRFNETVRPEVITGHFETDSTA